MDWNFFPPTQGRFNDEERSQKINRVSMDQLFHNIDALLKRDINDCLSKHLDGLLRNNASIYKVGPSVQRRERIDYFETGEDGEEAVKCKTVREGYFSQHALKCFNTSVYKSQSVQTESSCTINGKPSTRFRSKKPATPPEICRSTRSMSKNDARQERLKLERLPLTSDSNQYDVFPSNGWWRSERSGESTSDSETEAEVINEAKSNSGLNVEIKSDIPDHCSSLDVCSSAESVQLLFSSVVLENCNDGSKTQTRASSTSWSELSKIQGIQSEELFRRASETSSFLNLTSGYGNESDIIKAPRPPQPTPDLDDRTCQTCSENSSLSGFSRSTSFASNSAMFSKDLELGYRELFHYRSNANSRLDYNTIEAVKHYYSRPDKQNSFRKYFDKSRKITCVFPNAIASRAKNNKAIPLLTQEEAVKRRPNTADILVKLRLQHRSDALRKRFSKVKEENSTDERVLPTTLNKPTDASYSVMTPYMANVVWSVMEDEKVV